MEATLHPRQKHRWIFWWWMPLAGIVAIVFFVWENNNKKQASNTATSLSSTAKLKKIEEINEHKKDTANNIGQLKNVTTKENNVIVADNKQQQKKLINQLQIIAHPDLSNENISDKLLQKNVIADNTKKQNNSINILNLNTTTENNAVNTDTIQKKNIKVAKKDLVVLKSDSVKNVATNQSKKIKSKTNQWFIVAGAGTLAINNNSLLQNFSLPQANTGNVNFTNPGTAYNITNPQTGAHFTAGIRYKKEISTAWNFETGLQYYYLQNKQFTGNKTDTTMGFAAYYYKAGTTNSIINYAHAIDIPFALNYFINPKNKNKFYLQAGVSIYFLFAKKWLLTDEYLNGYYYNPSLIKNVQFNAGIGAGICFYNNMQAVIKVEQGFTPFYQINNKKYFKQQISAQLLFPINTSTKKKKINK